MKMPASGGDPVSATLRLAFSPGSKVGELDGGIEASAKRVLLTRIEYEPAINYQASVLNTLKSKYIVVNTKPPLNNTKTVINGTNVNTSTTTTKTTSNSNNNNNTNINNNNNSNINNNNNNNNIIIINNNNNNTNNNNNSNNNSSSSNNNNVNNNSKNININNNYNNNANKKSSNMTLPVPKLTLFPPERVQLGYRGNLSVGSGMLNMGNTCYLNSTLQALFHVPALVNWLVSETAHQNCVQNSDYQMHPDDITCSVIKTFKCSQQKTGNCMKPISVYSKLKAICKHLNHGSQEDAHEFMRYLLESLEKNYLTRFQGHKLDSVSKETTPINQIFGGYIRTEVVCLSCTAVSTTFQHFQDLPLDIRKASTLNDALAGYFERERLPDGEDAYKCEKCNKKVSVTKKFTIEKPPNVLCVQLKRFSMTNGKITKQVQLPQYLDITRFISSNIQPRHPVRYKLVSMVTHMGQSVNCGHYTAIALAANGCYYQFDDTSVRQIPLNTVLNMSAYLILYEMERPFQAVNPRPYPAPSTVVCNGNINVGEDEENWPQAESSSTSNSEPTNAEKENKREGTDSQSRMVCQLNKHGKAHAPPVHPTREPPSSNHQLHTKKGTKNPLDSNSKRSSLVPYESDVSTDSDVEKDRSELEKLLTKMSSSSTKGWKVTEFDDSVGGSAKACTTSWDVTEVKTPKLVRNLSDTELDGRKKKKVRTSGSDSELDKSSTKFQDKKKRTSILEKYKTNFGRIVEINGKSDQIENEEKTKHSKRENEKTVLNDSHSVSGPKEEKTPSKNLQFNKLTVSNETNGYSNGKSRTKAEEEDSHAHGNETEKPDRGDFRSKDSNALLCEKLEKDLERKREIVNVLLQNSHWGYGNSTVKSWNGTQSALEREVEEERIESTKRSLADLYNEDFDRGKAKKLKMDGERDRPRYNLFQKKQQKYNEKLNHYRWRGNNGNAGRYGHDYRHQYKRQPFNSQFNGNNWNYSKKNYKFFTVPRSNRKSLGVGKFFRSLPGKVPGPKKNQSLG